MKKLYLLVFAVFCVSAASSAASSLSAMTIPPPEPLRLYCNGETSEYNTFWVNPNSEIVLSANVQGNWTDAGAVKYKNVLRTAVNSNDQQFTFTADDGRQTTAFVRIIQGSCCLPEFDDNYPITINGDGEHKKIKTIQLVVGETFSIKAHYHRNHDCRDGNYDFYWDIQNNNGAIEISNPNASQTTMKIVKLPTGPNPEIYAVLSNGCTWPHREHITVQIKQPEPPVCKLDVDYSPSNWLSRSAIEVSFAGSHPVSEGDTIERYVAKLYYYDTNGQWQYIGENDYDSSEKTITASNGEGMYKVVGYVEDNHGQQSKPVETTIYIPGTRYDTPTIYTPRFIDCKVNETCFIYADTHNKDYPVEFFYGNTKLGNGPSGNFVATQPGTYKITVKTHRFGCDDCEDYYATITVRATAAQNITQTQALTPPLPEASNKERKSIPSFSGWREWLEWLYSG